MAALGFLMNAAGIAIPVGLEISHSMPKTYQHKTVVVISIGDGTMIWEDKEIKLENAGGNLPHIALWNDNGVRIGQHHPKQKDKVGQGGQCGSDWFLSSKRIGAPFVTPECVWLDADHTDGLKARALSFHLNEMIASADKIALYTSNSDYICKSTPRFSWWGNLLPDGIIPFFSPPIQYAKDTTSGGEGADIDSSLALDTTKNIIYNKGVYLHRGESTTKARRSTRPPTSNTTPKASKRQGRNKDPSHLITTQMTGHSARTVCEDAMSFGWDIVSLADNLYCDMADKVLYPLCDDAVKRKCFDLERKVLVGDGGVNKRGEASTVGVPVKRYETHNHWK